MARHKDPLSLAKVKYARHRAQSKYRNIGFNFSFDDWYNWWLSHGVDKNQDIKWPSNYRPCMCRKNDTGDYEPNNVYFANHVDNVKDLFKHGKGNPQGKLTNKKYKWNDAEITLEELKKIVPNIAHHNLYWFSIKNYDKNNLKESLRLKKEWLKLPFRTIKWWETPVGCFKSIDEAAASLNMKRHIFEYALKTKVYKKHEIPNIPTLEQYIRANSKFPNPHIPPDIN